MPCIDTLIINGDTRYYTYFEPDPATPDPLPLLVGLHGGGSNMINFFTNLGYPTPTPGLPFVSVFAQGFGPGLNSGAWNSGHSPAGLFSGRDDVAFIDALIGEIETRVAAAGRVLDLTRIYATGFSNGGMMVYRLAAELSSRFAAVAVMSGSIGGDPDPSDPSLPLHINDPALHTADPVAVLHIHGLADIGAPFFGGPSQKPNKTRCDLPVYDCVHFWMQHNNCQPVPQIAPHQYGSLQMWRGGTNGVEVQLVTAPGLGHEVPPNVLAEIAPFLLTHQK